MDQVNFSRLSDMTQHIEQYSAPVPLANRYIEYWYGAAFEVLGVRCAVSLEEIRKKPAAKIKPERESNKCECGATH